MNKLNRDGGSFRPSPGRRPRGAKKNEIKPASRSIPSDWYDEKSWSAPMHERKSTVHIATAGRGATLTISRTDATIPATTISVSAKSEALSQSRVGAYQTRSTTPRDVDSWWR